MHNLWFLPVLVTQMVPSLLLCKKYIMRMCRVEITVIDGEGKRHVIPGLEGQTVAQLLEQHTDILGPHGRSSYLYNDDIVLFNSRIGGMCVSIS